VGIEVSNAVARAQAELVGRERVAAVEKAQEAYEAGRIGA
jgi:hypothetical protein